MTSSHFPPYLHCTITCSAMILWNRILCTVKFYNSKQVHFVLFLCFTVWWWMSSVCYTWYKRCFPFLFRHNLGPFRNGWRGKCNSWHYLSDKVHLVWMKKEKTSQHLIPHSFISWVWDERFCLRLNAINISSFLQKYFTNEMSENSKV